MRIGERSQIATAAGQVMPRVVVVVLAIVAAASCARERQAAPAATPAVAAAPRADSKTDDAPLPDVASPYDALPESMRGVVLNPFTGDLDEMVKRRVIRVGVTFNRTHYFIDKGQQRGLTYESIKQFEDDLNADLKTGNLKVHVAAVPLSRDQLASALLTGKVDIVAAMVTVTPERRASPPFRSRREPT